MTDKPSTGLRFTPGDVLASIRAREDRARAEIRALRTRAGEDPLTEWEPTGLWALLNTASPDTRRWLLERLIAAQSEAHLCVTENHRGRITAAESAPRGGW